MDGMEPPKDGGGFSAAPPPVDGLGNYKGVMLCNRPVEDSNPSRMRGAADGALPFKSTVREGEREQLGLQPCRVMEPRNAMLKTRGPSAALRRHMLWIKELQVQVADENQRVVEDDQRQESRKQTMQALFKEQRDAIKELKSQGLNAVNVKTLESHLDLKAKLASKKQSAKKPLWAMTEEEKEGAEDEEAALLIDFAENLDYEKYMDDSEFRQYFKVVQDRANRIQKEQDKFKDDLIADFNQSADGVGDEFGSAYTGSPRASQADAASQLGDLPGRTGRARGARGDEGSDWDASTAMGDDGPRVDREARSDAGSVLDSRPQLKGIHSKQSMERVLAKVREGTPSEA